MFIFWFWFLGWVFGLCFRFRAPVCFAFGCLCFGVVRFSLKCGLFRFVCDLFAVGWWV